LPDPLVTRYRLPQVVTPIDDDDIANKKYVDDAIPPGKGGIIEAGTNDAEGIASGAVTFFAPWGPLSGGVTEAPKQRSVPFAGTLRNVYIDVITSNASTTDVDMTSRIEGVTGNLVVKMIALTTGTFFNIVNTDVISQGDKLCWSCQATTTGNIVGGYVSAEYV